MKGKIPKILSVALALVLALSLSMVMAVPVAADVTAAIVTPSDIEVGANADYTITFNTTELLEGGDRIRITFPDGTTGLENILATDVTVDGTPASAVALDGLLLSITLGAGAYLAGPREVVIGGAKIVNPVTGADNYTLDVSTNWEPNPVPSLPYSIVDFTDLDTAVAAAAALVPAHYTTDSWTAFETARDFALALPEDTNAEVVAKTTAINGAIDALVFAGQADLDTAVAAAGALVEADYTEASWADLQTALDMLETTNDEVVAKTTAITDAIAALVFAGQEALDAAVAAAGLLNSDDYTEASWADLQTALALPATTNTQVLAKTAAINTAIAALVFAGQEALDTAVAEAAALVPADYTAGSWTVLQTELALPEDTNAEVEDKTAAINAAIAALEAVTGDLATYDAALAAVTQADYTPESWAAYQDIVADNVVTADDLQSEIDAATAAITTAQGALIFAGQADLDTAVAAAAALVPAHYTTDSWTAFETARDFALALPEDTNAEVVAKTTAINGAIDALVFAGQADLDTAVAAAGALVEADYTEASWADLQTALDMLETTNDEVVAKTTAITDAIAALVFAGQEALDAAVAAAGLLNSDDYTEASWADLQTALALPATTNTQVLAKTAAINTAMAALVRLTSLDLAFGWNLISLPLIPDVAAIGPMLASIADNVDVVWGYDPVNSPDDPWAAYKPGVTEDDLTKMVDGMGYWIYMTSPGTLTVSGVELPEPPAVPPTYGVVSGWNLIGFKSIVDIDNDVYLANIAPYTILWGYEADGGYFSVYPMGEHDGDMEVGHGYWLWATSEGIIVLPQ